MNRKLAILFCSAALMTASTFTQAQPRWEQLVEQSNDVYRSGDPQGGLALAQQALKSARSSDGEKSPAVANCLRNLGETYAGMGDPGKARDYYQQSMALYEQTLGKDDPEIANTLERLVLLNAMGQASENGPLLERILSIRERALGADSLELTPTLSELSQFYQRQVPNLPRAEQLQVRNLSIWEKHSGPHSQDIVDALIELADVYTAEGQHDKAVPLYKRAVDINTKSRGATHWSTLGQMKKLAAAYRQVGRTDAAKKLEKRIAAAPAQ